MTAGRRLLSGAVGRVPFPYRAGSTPMGVEPPPSEPRSGAGYDTAWARRYPARFGRALVVEGLMRPTMRVLASPRISGEDRLSGLEGAAIFAANHHSHIDTPLLLSSIPEPWRHRLFVGAAADYFFRNRVTSAVSALAIGAIPIERTKVTRRSADLAAGLLEQGWSMLIFPEGGRSPDGWGQPFRGGAAYLSSRCSVPVVPIHVDGTGAILRKGSTLPRPAATRVAFGHPMHPEPGEDSRHLAARLEEAVATLADELTTDWWQARTRAHAQQTPPLSGPNAPSWRRAWARGERDRRRRRSLRRWPALD